MRALATILRIFATLSMIGLAAVLWMKWEDFTSQEYAFLDEVVADAYTILQSSREDQWKDISQKKSHFDEIFDANEPVGQNDENPLAVAASSLNSAENVILKNPEYGESLDALTMEYGVDALLWNPESKRWQRNPAVKLSPPAGFTDPFANEKEFPKRDVKQEDGTVIRGVPRDFRLRTVIGMFYKDRNDRFKEASKLRDMIVERDKLLREYQYLYSKEKQRKEELEDENGKLSVEIEVLNADLKLEKEERQKEREAAETREAELSRQNAKLEEERILTKKQHEEFIDQLQLEHKEVIAGLKDDIQKADAEGYDRAMKIMTKEQQGDDSNGEAKQVAVNPFLPSTDGPPQLSKAEMMLAAQASTIGESGVPSTVGRIDGKSGMILLPIGSERGVVEGSVFTLWKEKRKAARIRIQSVSQGFCIAYLLPQFGNPQSLRPGDSVHVVPELEETL